MKLVSTTKVSLPLRLGNKFNIPIKMERVTSIVRSFIIKINVQPKYGIRFSSRERDKDSNERL